MAVKSQIRGTQRDMWYASAWAACRLPRQADANFSSQSNANAGVFGGKVLKLTGLTNPLPMYVGLENLPDGVAPISILWRFVPNFTGLPALAIGIFEFSGLAAAGNAHGGLSFKIGTNGKMSVYGALKNSSTTTFNSLEIDYVIPFVTNTPIDIWFTWDGIAGASKGKLWVASNGNTATNVASVTAANGITWDKFYIPSIELAAPSWGAINTALDINEIVVFDSNENPASYGARTDFIPTTAAAFEAYSNTDVGVANVRKNTTYVFQGLTKTGLAYIPVAGDTKHDVNTDQTVGTYRGADLWDAIAAGELKHDLTKNQNGSSILGTYRGADLWDAIAATELKHGLTKNQNGSSIAGTYQGDDVNDLLTAAVLKHGVTLLNRNVNVTGTYGGSDLWDAVLATELKHGVTKNQNGSSILGTYRGADLWTAVLAADLKHAISQLQDGANVIGTYRGADLWTSVDPSNLARGIEVLQNGVIVTGERDTVTNVIEEAICDGAEVSNTAEIEGVDS